MWNGLVPRFCVGRSCRVRPFAAEVILVAPGSNAPPNTSNLPLPTPFLDDPVYGVNPR